MTNETTSPILKLTRYVIFKFVYTVHVDGKFKPFGALLVFINLLIAYFWLRSTFETS